MRRSFSGHLLNLDHVTLPSLGLKTCCHMAPICVKTPPNKMQRILTKKKKWTASLILHQTEMLWLQDLMLLLAPAERCAATYVAPVVLCVHMSSLIIQCWSTGLDRNNQWTFMLHDRVCNCVRVLWFREKGHNKCFSQLHAEQMFVQQLHSCLVNLAIYFQVFR